MVNMDEAREWVKTRTAVSAATIQRTFLVGYPSAARVIETLQAEGRITEDWDASEGGYVVLGRQSNTGLQADTCQSHSWNETHTNFKFCPDCGQPLARAAKA